MLKIHSFNDWTRLVIFLYRTIGEDLYDHRATNNIQRHVLKIYFYLSYLHTCLMVCGEVVFVYKGLQSTETLFEALGAAPVLSLSFCVGIKHAAMAMNKRTLCENLDELEEMHPKSKMQRQAYKLRLYEKNAQRSLIGLFLILLGFWLTFTLYPIGKSSLNYFLLSAPNYERIFGFPVVYPYDATGSLVAYWLTFLSQTHCAYFAGVAYLMADVLMVIEITQICMHFDYISDSLERYMGDAQQDEEDLEHLKRLIQHHNKCLALSEQLNNVFSISLLLNFGAATFTICFVGFTITSSNLENTIRYACFLLSSVGQVFVMCYYGHYLMEASSRVGVAAYNGNWYDCSQTYKRMLYFMIARSRKPAALQAPFIPPISLATFMTVVSVSYKFFALLRTTFEE